MIEWKYLKSKANNQRIIIDFVKLALPDAATTLGSLSCTG